MPRLLYIVGGPPRVGKSALGQRIMERCGVPWLSTDIVRTVLRTVVPEIAELDRGHSDRGDVAKAMYPFLQRAADVALHHSDRYLLEGVEWLPRHVAPLTAVLKDVSVKACFLGHATYSAEDLAAYRGVNRWHESAPEDERHGIPEWVRRWSEGLRAECADIGQPYVDIGELGFHEAMAAAESLLVGSRPSPSQPPTEAHTC